jgi:hypothetical protein
MIPLTSTEIEHLASVSAKAAVRETLLTLGVNANDPDAVLKMQLDFAHLREWRETTAAIKARGWMVLTGMIVSSIAAAIWMAVKGH